MNSDKLFQEWLEIITTRNPLGWDDMDELTKELLPGYAFKRSSYGPRATKYLYNQDDKQIYSSNYNIDVGMHILELAADTEYKKAMLDVHKAEKEIAKVFSNLRSKYYTQKFQFNATIQENSIKIIIKESVK
jgi:hypothetical protein